MSIQFVGVFALLATAPKPIDAPVTHVTVFSDRAHVTRTASVPAGTSRQLVWPLLTDHVDPATLSVGATGGVVERVDIARVEAEDFPRGEAQKLLADIERLDDQITRVRGERSHTAQVFETIRTLAPAAPEAGALKPVPKLNPTGWTSVLSFVESWSEKLQGTLRTFDEKLIDLFEARAPLADRARLLGGGGRRSGYRVTVTLANSRPAKIALSYVAHGARWYPTYDIQFAPDRGQVDISFAGLVSQESGEDWTDAALVLSTAVPATSTVFPKLYTWKIGERERFIPTPRAAVEYLRPPPPAAPVLSQTEDGEAALRQQLLARVSEVTPAADEVAIASPKPAAELGDAVGHALSGKRRYEFERRKYEERRRYARGDYDRAPVMTRPSAPPPEAYPSPVAAPRMKYRRGAPASTAYPAPAGPATGYIAETPQEGVGFAPPPGYRRPIYAPNLPVSLAGGYDLTFKSLRPETIQSGKGARRVALLTERWPVTVERKLFPALATEAYLVAEIKNPSQTVLPGGTANLFVGADPAGVARLSVVAPGEPFTLPLGLDRAIKPIRNVRQNTVEKGFFSKDEITEYVVTIEVANPYRVPVATRIIDQMPMTTDKNVELKLSATEPNASPNADTGALEWRVEIPASGKSTVTFSYTLRRPKGYRLHQN
jgi:hypothetical protein